jgi:hypothetical protein
MRLEAMGALAAGTDGAGAAAVLSMMTSPAAYASLGDESGWTLDECERWLTASLQTLLLAPDVGAG